MGQLGKDVKIMATRREKTAITFAIILVTVLIGVTFIMTDEASAQVASSSSSAVIVSPGSDDRIVARRPFFNRNPFLFEDEFFGEENEFFFERRPFFFDREEFFFQREERDD
jgi:hypothetical protein